jgi:hypothetical protein
MLTVLTTRLINARIITNGKSKLSKVYLVQMFTENKHHLICNLYYNSSPINQYKFNLYGRDYLIELKNYEAKLLDKVIEISGKAIQAKQQYCLTKSKIKYHGNKCKFNKSRIGG